MMAVLLTTTTTAALFITADFSYAAESNVPTTVTVSSPSCTSYNANQDGSVHTRRGARSIITIQDTYAVAHAEVRVLIEGAERIVGPSGVWTSHARPMSVSLNAASVDRVTTAVLAEPNLLTPMPPEANAQNAVAIPAIFDDDAVPQSMTDDVHMKPMEKLAIFEASGGTVRRGADGEIVVKGAGWGGSRGLWVLEVELPPALTELESDESGGGSPPSVSIKEWSLVLCEVPPQELSEMAALGDGKEQPTTTDQPDGAEPGTCEADADVSPGASKECADVVSDAMENFPGASGDEMDPLADIESDAGKPTEAPEYIETAIDDMLFAPPILEETGVDDDLGDDDAENSAVRAMSSAAEQQQMDSTSWVPVKPAQVLNADSAVGETSMSEPSEGDMALMYGDGDAESQMHLPSSASARTSLTWPLPSAETSLRDTVDQMNRNRDAWTDSQQQQIFDNRVASSGSPPTAETLLQRGGDRAKGAQQLKQILPTLDRPAGGFGGGGQPILPLLREVTNQYTDYTASQSGVVRNALGNVLRVYLPPIGPLVWTWGLVSWGASKVKQALTPGPKKCLSAPFALNTLRVLNSLNDTLECDFEDVDDDIDDDTNPDDFLRRRRRISPFGFGAGPLDKIFNGFFARRRRVCGDINSFSNLPFLAFRAFWNPFALLPFGLTGVFRPFMFLPEPGLVDPLQVNGVDERFLFGRTGLFETKLLKRGDYFFRYKNVTNSSFELHSDVNNELDRHAYELYHRYRNGTLKARYMHSSVRTSKVTVDYPGTNSTEAKTRDGRDAIKLEFSRLHKKATGKYLDPERIKILSIYDRRDYFCRPRPQPKKLLFRLRIDGNVTKDPIITELPNTTIPADFPLMQSGVPPTTTSSSSSSSSLRRRRLQQIGDDDHFPNPDGLFGDCTNCTQICTRAVANPIIIGNPGFNVRPSECDNEASAKRVVKLFLKLQVADILNSCAFDGPPPVYTGIVSHNDVKVQAVDPNSCDPTHGFLIAVRYTSGLFDKQKAHLLSSSCLGSSNALNEIIYELWNPSSSNTITKKPNLCRLSDVRDALFVPYKPSNETLTFEEHIKDIDEKTPFDTLHHVYKGKPAAGDDDDDDDDELTAGRRRSLLGDFSNDFTETWHPQYSINAIDNTETASPDATFISHGPWESGKQVYGIPLYATEKFLDNTGRVETRTFSGVTGGTQGIRVEHDPFTQSGSVDYKPRFGFECFYPHEKYIRQNIMGQGNKGMRWYAGYGKILPGYKPYAYQYHDHSHGKQFEHDKDTWDFYGKKHARSLYDSNHTLANRTALQHTTFGYPWVRKTKSGSFANANLRLRHQMNGTNATFVRVLNKYDLVKRNFRGVGFRRTFGPLGPLSPFAGFPGPGRLLFPVPGRRRAPFPFAPAPYLRKQWLKNFKSPYIPAYYPLARGLGRSGSRLTKNNVTGMLNDPNLPEFSRNLTGRFFPGYRPTALKNAIYSPEWRPSRAFVVEEGIVVDIMVMDPKKGFAKTMELARASTEAGFCSAPGPAWFDETRPFAFGGLFAFLYPNLAGTFLDPTIGRDLAGPFFPNLRSFFQSRPFGALPFFRPWLYFGISKNVVPTNAIPVYKNVNMTTDDAIIVRRVFSGVYQDVPCNDTLFCNGTSFFTKGISFQKGRVLDVSNGRVAPESRGSDKLDKYDALFKNYNPDTIPLKQVQCTENSVSCRALAWQSDDESPFYRYSKERDFDIVKEKMRRAASTSKLLGDGGDINLIRKNGDGLGYGDGVGYPSKLLRLPFVVNLPLIGPFFALPGPFLPARFAFRASVAFFSRVFYPAGACPWPCVSALRVEHNGTQVFRVTRCVDPAALDADGLPAICPFGFGVLG